MSFEAIDIMNMCKRLIEYNLGVKSGESVVIVTDSETDTLLAQTIAAASSSVGAEPTIMVMVPRTRPNEEPPKTVAAAMKEADVIIFPAKFTLTHTNAVRAARPRSRVASMPGVTCETLVSPSVKIDWEEMHEVGNKILEKFRRGNKITITSLSGTNLTATFLKDGEFGFESGIAREPGSFMMFPSGAVTYYFARPPERAKNTAEGVAVFDACHMFGKLKESMKWIIEEGWVVEIQGGEEAKMFREMIKGIQNANYLEEIAIGTNPAARFIPEETSMTEVKRKRGTVHIGIGGGFSHFDGLILEPTVKIDRETIVERGRVKV